MLVPQVIEVTFGAARGMLCDPQLLVARTAGRGVVGTGPVWRHFRKRAQITKGTRLPDLSQCRSRKESTNAETEKRLGLLGRQWCEWSTSLSDAGLVSNVGLVDRLTITI